MTGRYGADDWPDLKLTQFILQYIVVDEGHRLKNLNSKYARFLDRLHRKAGILMGSVTG